MAGIGDLRGRVIITDSGALSTLRSIKGGLDQVGATAQRVGTTSSQYIANIGRSVGNAASRLHDKAVAVGAAASQAGLNFQGIVQGTKDFNEAKFGYQFARMNDFMKDGKLDAVGLKNATEQAAKQARQLALEYGIMPSASMKALEEVQKIGIGGSTGESLWRAALGLSTADKDLSSGEAVQYLGAMYRAFAKQREAEAKAAGIDPDDPLFINQWLKGISAKSAVAAAKSALGPRDLIEGLRQYAPQWAQFGNAPEFAMAALAHGSNYGFRAPELGTAFKSMASRVIKPTNEGLRWMNSLGIDRKNFMSVDAADPAKAVQQLNSLLGGQLNNGKGGKARMNEVSKMLREGQKEGTTATPEFQERLTNHIVNVLGKKTEEDVASIQQAVSNATLTSGGQVNLPGLLKELVAKGAGPAALMAIFEGKHYARGTPMFEFYEKMMDLFKELNAVGGDSLDATVETRKGSEAGKTAQLQAQWEELLLTMEETGVIDAAKDALFQLAEALRKIPPDAVAFGTTALLVAGGISAVGMALIGIKAALELTGLLALGKMAGGAVIGGTAAAGTAAAGAGVAGGAVLGRVLGLGRVGLRAIPALGLLAMLGIGGYAGYEEYKKTGDWRKALKKGFWGGLLFDPTGGGDGSAQGAPATSQPPSRPPLPPATSGDMAGDLGIGNIEGAARAEAEARTATAEAVRTSGQELQAGMAETAGGVRASGNDLVSAIASLAAQIATAAQSLAASAAALDRVHLNTGPSMAGQH